MSDLVSVLLIVEKQRLRVVVSDESAIFRNFFPLHLHKGYLTIYLGELQKIPQ